MVPLWNIKLTVSKSFVSQSATFSGLSPLCAGAVCKRSKAAVRDWRQDDTEIYLLVSSNREATTDSVRIVNAYRVLLRRRS